MLYLDNAATTPVHDQVLDAIFPYLMHEYGNPGGMYSLGISANEAIESSRRKVASLLSCKPEQIIFTSGGAEANSLAIMGSIGYMQRHKSKNGTHRIVISASEHDSVFNAAQAFARNDHLCECVRVIPVNEFGKIQTDDLDLSLRDNSDFVSMMYINNEVGAINDINRIASICKAHGARFHIDAVQAVSSHRINVEALGCDSLSISGHKIGAPKGVGALYVKDPSSLSPIVFGGEQQEHGLRGGTANVAGIVGLGVACELIQHGRLLNVAPNAIFFAEYLKNAAKEIGYDFKFNTDLSDTYIKVLSVQFPNVDAQTLVMALNSKWIFASAGSACHSKNRKPSRVLKAMGLTDAEAMSTVRFSFDNEAVETETLIDTAYQVIRTASQLSKLAGGS